jgi:hypothetical protein
VRGHEPAPPSNPLVRSCCTRTACSASSWACPSHHPLLRSEQERDLACSILVIIKTLPNEAREDRGLDEEHPLLYAIGVPWCLLPVVGLASQASEASDHEASSVRSTVQCSAQDTRTLWATTRRRETRMLESRSDRGPSRDSRN